MDTAGKKHEVELQLGGMGGGGAVQLEVNNVISTIVCSSIDIMSMFPSNNASLISGSMQEL